MKGRYETGATVFIPDRVIFDRFSESAELRALAKKYIEKAALEGMANRYIELTLDKENIYVKTGE